MYSHGLIRFRCDFFLLLTGRWQLNLSFQALSRRWKIFLFFHLGFVLYEKDNTLFFKGFASCIPKKGYFCCVFSPRKHNQHAKSGWKCSYHSQTKRINLFILVNDDLLWSLLCSGKRGSKGSCRVNLLAPQQGPHPSPPSSYSRTISCTVCSLQSMSVSWPCWFGGQWERLNPSLQGMEMGNSAPLPLHQSKHSQTESQGNSKGGSHFCFCTGESRHMQGPQRHGNVSWHALNWGHSAPSARNPWKNPWVKTHENNQRKIFDYSE